MVLNLIRLGILLSVWFLVMSRGSTRVSFLGFGRITSEAYFGRVDWDPQSARGLLSKTTSIVTSRLEITAF